MNSTNLLKSVSAALIAAFLLAAAPLAARAEEYDWTGAYAGVNVGAGMYESHVDDPDCWNCSNQVFHDRLIQGGVNGGYNKQFGSAVLGLGAEINLGSQNRRAMGELSNVGNSRLHILSKIDWSGALLARAGMAVHKSLVYVTAGPAIAHVEGGVNSAWSRASGNLYRAAFNNWQPAFKAGVGAEFMVSEHASVAVQYSTLIVADRTAWGAYSGQYSGRNVWANTQSAATVGANWHF